MQAVVFQSTAEAVGCSNNYLSHIETAQCKLSLSMLLRLSLALGESTDFFLLDTPYAPKEAIINRDIAAKLAKCGPARKRRISDGIIGFCVSEGQRRFSQPADGRSDEADASRI